MGGKASMRKTDALSEKAARARPQLSRTEWARQRAKEPQRSDVPETRDATRRGERASATKEAGKRRGKFVGGGDRSEDDGVGGRLSAAAHSRRAEHQTTTAKEAAQIASKDEKIASKDKQIASKDKQIASKDKQIASLEAELKAERANERANKRRRGHDEVLRVSYDVLREQHQNTVRIKQEKQDAEGVLSNVRGEKEAAEANLEDAREELEDANELVQQQSLFTDRWQGRFKEVAELAVAAGADPSVIAAIRNRPMASGS